MCEQTNFEAILSVTSSLASAAGRSPCDSPDGQMTAKSGPEAAPASHSASPAKDSVPQTSGTCGPCSPSSLRSESLQHALASKLRAALAVNGSPEYALTWRRWDMQSGPQICALRASARRKSGSGSIGWPTPMVNDELGSGYCYGKKRTDGTRPIFLKLPGAAQMAGWPTPDTNKRGGAQHPDKRIAGGHSVTLQDAAMVAGWATPTTRDHKDTGDLSSSMTRRDGKRRNDTVPRQAFGTMPLQSPAATEKRGALNPDLPRWLMGFPPAWCACAVTAMQSFPKSRRRSSGQA